MANVKKAQSVPDFLASLPADRRSEVELVRSVICHNLPTRYEKTISKNMLVYQVPIAVYSDTYNGHPLWYVALASEKSYLSLHLMPVYGDSTLSKELSDGFKTAGKKLDMGKACVHFRTAQDLALSGCEHCVGGSNGEMGCHGQSCSTVNKNKTPNRAIEIGAGFRRTPATGKLPVRKADTVELAASAFRKLVQNTVDI